MTPHRWQTIKQFFNAAVDLPPAERAGFLERACRGDESVRREVESLLAAHVRGESFLAIPAFEIGARLLADSLAVPTAGDQIGRYKILSQLGSGGMGEVYLALDTTLGRNIALKLLPFDLAGDEHRMRRFEQEARTASALNHPNVCVIHEIGRTEDGRQFIAMEYVEGLTLRARMEQRRLTVTEALDVGAQIAWALEAAHAAGVVHRDVKPENIMLRRDGYVKVLDFGIAKLNEKDSAPLVLNEASTAGKVHTEPGTRMGTVRYMSPEQLRERPVDERTDIWSLGIVLHEMVTGSIPFTRRTTNETIAAILERQPLKITDSAADVPDELREIIAKALRKRRRERYQKVSELAHDLRNGRRHVEAGARGASAAPVGVSPLNAKAISSQTSAERGTLPLPAKRRTLFSVTAASIITEIKAHKQATVFAGVAAVLVLAYLSLFMPRQTPPQPSPAINMESESLTSEGSSVCTAISPDGESVAHVEKKDGMQELRLTSLVKSASRAIVPALDVEYQSVTFSRDNNYLYFVRSDSDEVNVLYKVDPSAGATSKIKDRVDSPIAFSPRGDRFAFVRRNRGMNEYSLMIAGVDGLDERTIVTLRGGDRLSVGGPAWSPDGQSILCPTGSWDPSYHMNLTAFDVSDGHQETIGAHRWFEILQVVWLRNPSDVIISAREEAMSPSRLWRISYPQGEVSKITTDTTDYWHVSASDDGDKIVSVRNQQHAQIWVVPEGDVQRAKPITTGTRLSFGLSWTGKGKIVFSAMARDNLNLSLIDPDGSNLTQLTADAGDNYSPAASPDGRFIIFASNRSGKFNLWRINADDGGDPQPLTFTDGNFYPSCSADSQWVAYENQSDQKRTVRKIFLDGGEPRQLTNNYARMPVISPDDKLIACRYNLESGAEGIAIIPAEGGPPVKLLPIKIILFQRVQWSADGRSLTYIKTEGGTSNLWSYDLNGGPPRQLTNFTSEMIYSYAWSPDYKQLACERGVDISDVMILRRSK